MLITRAEEAARREGLVIFRRESRLVLASRLTGKIWTVESR